MRPAYLTPGVYYERTDAVAPAVTALRTDIAAFVGIAERGALHRAIPIQSWRQFQATFGNFIGSGYLAYAVKAFFENGGRKCYIVRVADRGIAASASVELLDANPIIANKKPAWNIEASSPGVWGNRLEARLIETRRAQTRTMPVVAPSVTELHGPDGAQWATPRDTPQAIDAAFRLWLGDEDLQAAINEARTGLDHPNGVLSGSLTKEQHQDFLSEPAVGSTSNN